MGKFTLLLKSLNHFTWCTSIIYTGKIPVVQEKMYLKRLSLRKWRRRQEESLANKNIKFPDVLKKKMIFEEEKNQTFEFSQISKLVLKKI